MNKKIVITRAQSQAEAFALNIVNQVNDFSMNDFVIEPMTKIIHYPIDIEKLRTFDNVIITSSNAVMSLKLSAPSSDILDNMRFFCVGEETAQRINLLDGAKVEMLAPTLKKLLDKLNAGKKSEDRRFLYLRGRDITFDIKENLGKENSKKKSKSKDRNNDENNSNNKFIIDEIICYKASAIECFSPNFREILLGGHIGAVSFFSKRTAEIFVGLLQQEFANKTISPSYFEAIKTLSISNSVRESLLAVFKKKDCIVSKTPDMKGMIQRIEEGLF